ncbi:hypothetical protein [Streptomyces sp. NPDC037389]|uniref:hypothetical protein n=1 Tax=Streptomyces sp. NPDC037389 TaxID=3155369 RepID=UPI00340298E9
MNDTMVGAERQTTELWNANQVAAALGLSPTEVGRRLKRGEPPLPRFRAGVNSAALWLPEEVRLYALQRGQALADHPGADRRLPVPMWLNLPPLPTPLPRIADEVLNLPMRLSHSPGPHPIHVRIWRGPAGNGTRTVCLLAGTDSGTVPPTVAPLGQIMAHEVVEAGLLTEDVARTAFWFGLGVHHHNLPDGDPQVLMYLSFALTERHGGLLRRWRTPDTPELFTAASAVPARLAQLAHLTGENLELYPQGTHTPEAITLYAAGQRPVVVDWDPYDLAKTVHRTATLRAWADAETKAGRERAAATITDAATALAARAAEIDTRYEHDHAAEEHTVVDRRVHRLAPGERDELLNYARSAGGEDFGHWLRLHRALAQLTDDTDTANLEDERALERHDALTAASASSTALLRPIAIAHASQRDGWPLRLTTTDNSDAARYLATCAWYGPKEEDTQTARLLTSALWEDERHQAQAAYDPFGRLVLATADRTAFAVTCPVAPGAGDQLMGAPGFIALPDGRYQLRPVAAAPGCCRCGQSSPDVEAVWEAEPDRLYCRACAELREAELEGMHD